MRRAPSSALLSTLALLVAGCGGSADADGPPDVEVVVGGQDVTARPTQYCLDGEWQRYTTTPPILEVSPDTPIELTVPDGVAERGWSVQVFDERLEETIGEVAVPAGTATYEEINTSDVVPPAFYLVVVEDSGGECGDLTAAWPIGFLRAGGDTGPTTSPGTTPAG